MPHEELTDTTNEPFLLKEKGYESKIFYPKDYGCLLYTSDAADERSSVDLGGRRIIKKKLIV